MKLHIDMLFVYFIIFEIFIESPRGASANASEIAGGVQVIFLFVDSLSYIYFRTLMGASKKWFRLRRFVFPVK